MRGVDSGDSLYPRWKYQICEGVALRREGETLENDVFDAKAGIVTGEDQENFNLRRGSARAELQDTQDGSPIHDS